MSAALTHTNQEITNCFLVGKTPDFLTLNKELKLFDKSLQLEKHNITEIGEDKLAYGIDAGFNEYRDSVLIYLKSPKSIANVLYLQKKFDNLYQQLGLLSQMNSKAIEIKTADAKISAKTALLQMTFVGSLCFIIAFVFTFSFASYFNERFYQLYNGIKEIVSSHYDQRLYFKGKDEFYDLSLVFNEMAEKLSINNREKALTLREDSERETNFKDIQELKRILLNIKSIEEQAETIISKYENLKI
jgi:methyl-accepting chemotaxis protein